MAQSNKGSRAGVLEAECTEQLARFFPELKTMRVPAELTLLRASQAAAQENVVVEFGGVEHAIFLAKLPLEYNDKVRMHTHGQDGAFEASVVGMQFDEGQKAIAVRFRRGSCNWVTKT